MGAFFVLLGILAAACSGPSRSASTPVDVPGGQPGGEPTQAGGAPGEATDAPSQVETLMAGELATQTASAGGQPTGVQPTGVMITVESIPTDTPSGNGEAAPGATEVPPTATQVPPTNTPQPEPAVNCSSPYTVKKGDWVWNIGRSCNIHPNSIIAANNLYYPYTIYPGDVLILPDNAPPFPGP
jgi:LysM repeat protein